MTIPTAPQGATLTLVPWVRQGVTAAITALDSNGSAQPAVADFDVALAVNGLTAPTVKMRLRGPADVTGIDRDQIVRMEPRPGTLDFEPNYFACVEFDRADFPWLFTPAKVGATGRLRPWLCLVVVRKQAGVSIVADPDAPLPKLQIASPALPAAELPNLTDAWAWAHAQAAGLDSSPGETASALGGAPERSLSRLICPRILAPETEYVACVVPTFDVGRKAGLGLPIADATDLVKLLPAWATGPSVTSVALPVYHSWEFRTGVVGDFASLARALHPVPAPSSLGRRPIAIDAPGFDTHGAAPLATPLQVEGALRPIVSSGTPDVMPPWNPASAIPFQDALAGIVDAPAIAAVVAPNADPLLAPPLYGQWYTSQRTATRSGPTWFDQLNLDPRLRSVAAFGTRTIQEHQEALMASAWAQAGELRAANQRLRQLQMSIAIGESLNARHFARLSTEASVRVASPVFPRLRAAGTSNTGPSVRVQIAATQVPAQAISPAMRRIARQRGPLTRRITAQGGNRSGMSWVQSLDQGAAVLPGSIWWDLVTVTLVVLRLPQPATILSFAAATETPVASRGGMPWFVVQPEGQPVALPLSFVYGAPAQFDNPTSRAFRRAAMAHLHAVNPGRTAPASFAPHAASVASPPGIAMVQTAFITQTQPRQTIASVAADVVSMAPNAAPPASPSTSPVAIDTIALQPYFPQPMFTALRDVSSELILPGVADIAPDAVLGLETNRRFVEAFLVGLNFEMSRELLWRGFPTEPRATFFDQFWGGGPDIGPLHRWGNRPLGGTSTSPQSRENFVMLLRSPLLRRYPNAVIHLAKATMPTPTTRTVSHLDADEVMPLFSGAMPPDVAFFGFPLTPDQVTGRDGTPGYYVVIQEHPTEPRFGVQAHYTIPNATHVPVGSAPPAGMRTNGLTWARNSAHMAGSLRHRPVRLAIHASRFL